MKKFLLALVAMLGIAGFAFAHDPVGTTGTIGVQIGELWSIAVDGYTQNVGPDGVDNTGDEIISSTGADVNFGTINMDPASIFSTLLTSETAVTDINDYTDVPHRAASNYMDIRVYVSNNVHPFQVNFAIHSPFLDQSVIVPPIKNSVGGAAQSTMHLVISELTAAINPSVQTSHPANLDHVWNDTMDVDNKYRVPDALGLGIGGPRTATVYTSTVPLSDAFVAYLALDFLPLDIGTTPNVHTGRTTGYTNWSDGYVTWTLSMN